MHDHSLTRQERHLVFILRWWVVIFTIAGIGFLIFPDEIIKYLGTIGRTVFKWEGASVEPSTERFWLVLSISLMVVLVLSAIKAQLNIVRNISYVKIIIVSKLVSTLGFIYATIFIEHSFAYFAGALVDGLIFVITFYTYRMATISRYGK